MKLEVLMCAFLSLSFYFASCTDVPEYRFLKDFFVVEGKYIDFADVKPSVYSKSPCRCRILCMETTNCFMYSWTRTLEGVNCYLSKSGGDLNFNQKLYPKSCSGYGYKLGSGVSIRSDNYGYKYFTGESSYAVMKKNCDGLAGFRVAVFHTELQFSDVTEAYFARFGKSFWVDLEFRKGGEMMWGDGTRVQDTELFKQRPTLFDTIQEDANVQVVLKAHYNGSHFVKSAAETTVEKRNILCQGNPLGIQI